MEWRMWIGLVGYVIECVTVDWSDCRALYLIHVTLYCVLRFKSALWDNIATGRNRHSQDSIKLFPKALNDFSQHCTLYFTCESQKRCKSMQSHVNQHSTQLGFEHGISMFSCYDSHKRTTGENHRGRLYIYTVGLYSCTGKSTRKIYHHHHFVIANGHLITFITFLMNYKLHCCALQKTVALFTILAWHKNN